ncbi:hypothetical protein D3C85_1441460 [compost metagenome]
MHFEELVFGLNSVSSINSKTIDAVLLECLHICQNACASCWIETGNAYYERSILRHSLKFSMGLLVFQMAPKRATSSKPVFNAWTVFFESIPPKAMSWVV